MSRKFKKGELLTAFERGDIESVLKLSGDIPDFAKANIPHIIAQYKVCQGRSTPLTVAIQHGNYHLCRLLVQDGHSLTGDLEKCYHLRPLSLALHFKHSDIVELLIELGADVNMLDKNKNTYPLFWAIHEKENHHIIDRIISAGFPLNTLVVRKEKMTAIHCAVVENNIEAVKVLLRYPVELDTVDFKGNTALDVAIKQNFFEIVKLLIEKGANLYNRKSMLCPLTLAITLGHLKMTELLVDLGADIQEGWVGQEIVSPLHLAIASCNTDIIMLLLAKGANVNAKSGKCQETALHMTTVCSLFGTNDKLKAMQMKIVKALIEKGADVNAEDSDGRTPLDGAICMENIKLCKLLLKEGAKIQGRGYNASGVVGSRFEYICYIKSMRCPELIKMCLERGGDYYFRDSHGLTAYHAVLAKHIPDMVRLFWQHGCPYDLPELKPGTMKELFSYEPDPIDKKMFSTQMEFMDGIKNNRLDSVISALEKGAEPKGCSMKIPSTLHYVAASGNHNIAKVLLENGVAVNRTNEKGQTPLYIAVEKKNLQTCKVLLQYGACFDYQSKKLPKNKTIKILVRESDHLHQLFRKVYKCFKLAKEGDHKLLNILEKYKNSEEEGMINVLMNCVNRKGFTLLATVLSLGYKALAEDLMHFRLKYM